LLLLSVNCIVLYAKDIMLCHNWEGNVSDYNEIAPNTLSAVSQRGGVAARAVHVMGQGSVSQDLLRMR